MQKITPMLWFDGNAEEAARFYTKVFKDGRMGAVTHFSAEGAKASGMKEGSVMTVSFRINGMDFVGLNGGPQFTFSEAISFAIMCKDQKEIDYYWNALTKGGKESVCGWLKDKYGLSWQVVPNNIGKYAQSPRAMAALMKMKKIEIKKLKR